MIPRGAQAKEIDGVRLRGHEVARIESFSDAVLGFALTLLVVSLDVPKSFDALFETLRGFPAFALCFLFLAMIWNAHYKFCRRYGLDDFATRSYTFVLLFLVLLYVYPLKFLFYLFVNNVVPGATGRVIVGLSQWSLLLIIYGLGFAAVYGALALLYFHAWRMRALLDLNARAIDYPPSNHQLSFACRRRADRGFARLDALDHTMERSYLPRSLSHFAHSSGDPSSPAPPGLGFAGG